MDKQKEIEIPENNCEFVDHTCQSELARQEKAAARGKQMNFPQRRIAMCASLDPRWLVGSCPRCHETITRKVS